MVDTSPNPRGRRSDALAGDQSHARTTPFCARSRERPVDDDRALRAVRHQSQHRLKVVTALPPAWRAGTARSQSGPAIIATPNARRHRRVDSAGTHPIRVGGPQDLETPANPGSGAGLARPGPASPPPAPLETSGRGADHHDRPESDLDDRFQGPVPDAERDLLLPADDHRSLQPLLALLPGAPGRRRAGGQTAPPPALSDLRTARGDPQ